MPHWLCPTAMHHDAKRMVQHIKACRQREDKRRQASGQFDFPVSSVGKTADGRVMVWYDPALGDQGLRMGQLLLGQIQAVMELDDGLFGVEGLAGNLLLVSLSGQSDGSGGAYHYGCAFDSAQTGASDWYIDYAALANGMDLGLAQAEISESYMGLQGLGWDCGGSNGEGLSRVLAEQQCGGPTGALKDFQTFPSWQQAGSPDWINMTEPTDQNPVSTGCAVGYLYWMQSLGYSWADIIQAGCPDGSLASNYKALTGKEGAWDAFMEAVGQLTGPITTDNPWPLVPAAKTIQPTAQRASTTPVLPLLESIAAGVQRLIHPGEHEARKLLLASHLQLLQQVANMLRDLFPPAK